MQILKVQSKSCRTKVTAEAQLQIAVAAKLNAIVYNVHQSGAHYNSMFYTRCSSIETGFDPLGYLSQRGAELGINVFAWIAPGADCYQFNTNWDLSGKYGAPTELHWLDFSLPEARQRVVDIAKDIISKYKVGISLDYIRYPDTYYPTWQPDMIHPGTQLSHKDIADTVLAVRQAVTGTTKLLAHVRSRSWGGVCQDWQDWLRNGLIDKALPMIYVNAPGEITTRVNAWDDNLPQNKIIPTLTLYSGTASKSLEEVQIEIDECKSLGFTEFAYFDSRQFTSNVIELIRKENIMPIQTDLIAIADTLDTKIAEISALVTALSAQATAIRTTATQLDEANALADELAALL